MCILKRVAELPLFLRASLNRHSLTSKHNQAEYFLLPVIMNEGTKTYEDILLHASRVPNQLIALSGTRSIIDDVKKTRSHAVVPQNVSTQQPRF